MRTTLLISVATAALMSTTGFVSAQSPGNSPNAPAASQSAPTAAPSAPAERSAPMNRGDTDAGRAGMNPERGMKDTQADQMKPGDKATGKSAQDNMRQNQKTDGKASDTSMDRSKDGMKTDKNAADNNAKAGTTTGQAGSGAKLSTEQRTQVRTVITKQNVKPVTNINFSISVGTHVPRTVGFHALPAEVVTIYPDWRGYEFFLVNDQVVVVNPRTLEIVAVLDA